MEDLTLDTSTSGRIQLQWSAVPGSTSYTIYKVEQSLGGLTDVITFDQNNLNSSSSSLQTITNVASGCVSGTWSHTDASLITNKKWYYYRIAAVNGRGQAMLLRLLKFLHPQIRFKKIQQCPTWAVLVFHSLRFGLFSAKSLPHPSSTKRYTIFSNKVSPRHWDKKHHYQEVNLVRMLEVG